MAIFIWNIAMVKRKIKKFRNPENIHFNFIKLFDLLGKNVRLQSKFFTIFGMLKQVGRKDDEFYISLIKGIYDAEAIFSLKDIKSIKNNIIHLNDI